MTTRIALLRGINVGGNKKVAMADLRDMAAGLGLTDVRTVLQTGNLVFAGGKRDGPALERLLEAEARAKLSLDTQFFVRTAAEWERVVEQNPFGDEAERDPGHLVVWCLKAAPGAAQVRALQAAITGREVARVVGREAYLVYPDGIGGSRLTAAVLDRALGVRGTGRNWNTVLKLAASAAD